LPAMKKFLIVLAALTLLFIAPTVAASDKQKDDSSDKGIVTVPAGEVVNKDYFAAGGIVEISGTVNGDVYAFGGQVLVDGKVNGDLIAAGGVVRISGDISQDARVGGGQVTISGSIGRNLTVGGGNIELAEKAVVRGSVIAGGGNISLASPIGGNAKVGGGNLTVSNKIAGDLEASISSLRLTSKSQIGGNLTYFSDQKASIDKEAKVAGSITQKKPAEVARPSPAKILGIFTGISLFLKIISFVSTLILGLLLLKFFPKYSRDVVYTLRKRPWVSLGIGFAALILIPIIFVILLVTVVGIPLAFILLALYLISLYVARIFVIFWSGVILFERTGRRVHEVWAFILGLVIYSLLTLIPIIGGIITLFVVLFGLGAAILTKRDLYLLARKRDIF